MTDDGEAAPSDGRYVLRLFVTGTTPRSTRAVENLRHLLEKRLPGRYALEVIDIYQHPELARANQIVAAPTLLKLWPEPVRRVIGDLADELRLVDALAIEPEPSDGKARVDTAPNDMAPDDPDEGAP